jgi:hypothetical protein
MVLLTELDLFFQFPSQSVHDSFDNLESSFQAFNFLVLELTLLFDVHELVNESLREYSLFFDSLKVSIQCLKFSIQIFGSASLFPVLSFQVLVLCL